jgi:pentatricopeptide repeat protein
MNRIQCKILASPAASGYRGISTRSQNLSVQQPTRELDNFYDLKAGADDDDDDDDDSEHKQAQTLSKSRSAGGFNGDQKEWYKMMNKIRFSGDAVSVLKRLRKANKLSRETILGTLVRLKQLKVWNSVVQICEWLIEENWWQFGFEDYCLLMVAYGKEGEPEKAEKLMQRFSAAGYKSNIAMHTCLIEAYGQKRIFDKVESAIRSLLEAGPAPTVTTYHIVMKAYVKVWIQITGGLPKDVF